jgi:lipopolysaccharide/colanic/teichoic acid biosynthesis glycosyltransferase
MLMVRIKHGSPIFFRQKRTGKNFKPFMLMKFRTMSNATDSEGTLLPDHLRLTKFGLWLRNTSLDELPELINIIKGDMAVIGPRPLLPEYDAYYTDREKHRFDVRGGLIPPESLHTDSFLTWDKQLEYEASYAENLSFGLDLKILISVFKTMLKRGEQDYGGYERKTLIEERTKK